MKKIRQNVYSAADDSNFNSELNSIRQNKQSGKDKNSPQHYIRTKKPEIKSDFNEETQTLIKYQSTELVNPETGDIYEDLLVLSKKCYGKSFWKVYLHDFLNVLGMLTGRDAEVLAYILENTIQENNLFIGTYPKIASDTGINIKTVTRSMKKFQDNNFIKKIQNGVYMISPQLLVKGSNQKRGLLITYYNQNEADRIVNNKNTINAVLPPINEDEIECPLFTENLPQYIPEAKKKSKNGA